jgi:cephalosporin hydroxylase
MKAPKFSVLLPSKDRPELLMRAIESVRRQSVKDFEIIVSDNASSVPYAELIASLGDERIHYVRIDRSVPVTDNWNNALCYAKGDYVVMLGDDDALPSGYFEVMLATIAQFHEPEVIYCAAYHYCYPYVQAADPEGYLSIVLNSPLFIGRHECYELARSEAVLLAKKALHFHHYFSFNSQHFVWKRTSMDNISRGGEFFKSPYPDFYSSIMTFLNAKEIIVNPHPEIIIGISSKSFGYYFISQQNQLGNALLGHNDMTEFANDREVLSGSDHNTKWLLAAREVKYSMAGIMQLSLGIDNYRRLQIIAGLRRALFSGDLELKRSLYSNLRLREICFAKSLEAAMRIVRLLPSRYQSTFFRLLDRFMDQHFSATVIRLPVGRHQTVLDAIEWLDGKSNVMSKESKNVVSPTSNQGSYAGTSAMHVNPYLSINQQKLVDAFHDLYYSLLNEGRGVNTIRLSWLGHELFKCPMDLWLYQELIMTNRPDVIIETGTYRGGSAHYLASICELVGHGKVITIDVNAWADKARPHHRRLSYICGSSTSPSVLATVRKMVGRSKKVLVILDSDHSMAHVLAELSLYQQFIPMGGFMIVEDTNVNGHPTFPSHGPGPWEAVDAFLANNPEFMADRSLERLLLTMNPRGYLKRIAPCSKQSIDHSDAKPV